MNTRERLIIVLCSVLFIYGGYATYQYLTLTEDFQVLTTEFTELTEISDGQTRKITQLEQIIESEIEANRDLISRLESEKSRNAEFADQINIIAGTVGTLEKLSKTDAELLKKYSKVYFLNEHYTPAELVTLAPEYLYNEDRPLQIHTRVYPYLSRMVQDALADNIELYVLSAFRSFDTQSQLKSHYKVTYGSGANTFSADQGYSEHQLGTAVDFTTTGIGGGLDGFEKTKAYTWLQQNAHKYGFTLSYPENNAYYIFEPWHWRFVGVKLAGDLKERNLHFYDMSQRDIDEYLIYIFD